MKKIVRNIAMLLFSFVFVFFANAQNVKAVGVTDGDIKAFVKNYNTIEKELDKLDIEIDDSDINVLDYIKGNVKVESILEKNGISGPDRISKIKAICLGFSVEYYDQEVSADPETAALMQQLGMGDPMASLREQVNLEDRTTINKHLKALTA